MSLDYFSFDVNEHCKQHLTDARELAHMSVRYIALSSGSQFSS